jgi:RNA recognition motif-containing protein
VIKDKTFKFSSFVKFHTAAAAALAIEMFNDFKIGGCNLQVRYNVKRNENEKDSAPHALNGTNGKHGNEVLKNTNTNHSKTPTNGSTTQQSKRITVDDDEDDDDEWQTVAPANRKPIQSEISSQSITQSRMREPQRPTSPTISNHESNHSSIVSRLKSKLFFNIIQ